MGRPRQPQHGPPLTGWRSWVTSRQLLAVGVALLLVGLVVVLGVTVSASPNPDSEVDAIAAPTTEPHTTGTRGPRSPAPTPAPTPTPPTTVTDIPAPADDASPSAVERTTPDCSRCASRSPVPTAAASPPAVASETAPPTAPPPSEPPPEPPPDVQPQPNAALGLNELVNRDRLANGCPPVAGHPDLISQSQAHAERQAADDSMHHSDGVTGFNSWGENVAVGYDTAAEVHAAWMASPGHRAIILDCSYTYIGYGAADGPSGRYWTEQFAS